MQLSAYVLTCNSEKHLGRVLSQLSRVADDLVVLDSGSTDTTLEIAKQHAAKIHFRSFDDFIQQREFAASQCQYDWILFIDSDEVIDDHLVNSINQLKAYDFEQSHNDAYVLRRDWYVLGQPVHSIYPIKSPDFRVRLYHRARGHFDPRLPVHEKLIGFNHVGRVESGAIHHYTFETKEEFDRKLTRYHSLAVETMQRRGKRSGPIKAQVHAVAAFLKSWLSYQGWRDGRVGIVCARYAYRYTLAKYLGSPK
ncbi:MAG TPA: glycosyltransferase family 2 protein [Gammaproteobacteria bacterium]|nr:glycosyltransferase family 2 protein [Gammaproteobacteria bacterium]